MEPDEDLHPFRGCQSLQDLRDIGQDGVDGLLVKLARAIGVAGDDLPIDVKRHCDFGLRIDPKVAGTLLELDRNDDGDVLEFVLLRQVLGLGFESRAIGSQKIDEAAELFVSVLGENFVELLDQTGQGRVWLSGENHDDGLSAQLSPITERLADTNSVVWCPTALDNVKWSDRLPHLQAAFQLVGAGSGAHQQD